MSQKSRRANRKNQTLNTRLKEQQRHQSQFEKIRRAQAKERDRILLQTMRRSRDKGIYNPKELKLTKYRRYRANKALREFGEFLDPTNYFFVKSPKNARKKIVEKANSLNIKHTSQGLFIAKEGHTKAKLRKDRKRDEYFIERSGKTKRGPTRGVRYRTITPLASIDELDKERERFREMAEELGPLKHNERLTFKVIENGFEGYSHTTYSNVELLIKDLENYQKNIPSKVNFFRHIEIVKTKSSAQWFAQHPSTDVGRKGRKKRDEIRAKEAKRNKMRLRKARATKNKGRL